MTRRSRILSFGSAGLLVVVGALLGALVGGGTGQILALVLVGLGFVLATGLVFLEVGLSEDREREREGQQSRRRIREMFPRPAIQRSRGHRRRLR
jgi:hypothetical protein